MIRPIHNVHCDLCDHLRLCIMFPLNEHIREVSRVYLCEECLTVGLGILKNESKPKGSIKTWTKE